MTASREAALRTTQMKMLRLVLGRKRNTTHGVLEAWVDWIQRATADVRHLMEVFNIPDWVTVQRRKFEFVAKCARTCPDFLQHMEINLESNRAM